MKALQYLASIVLVLLGIVLLCEPAPGEAFTPTRFTVVDEGTAGKPDVVLIPGLSSSREVWAAEAVKLAPNYRLHLVQIDGFAGQAAGPNATGEILPALVDELHGYITAARMRPVVVGHSLGGLLALMLAEKYPSDARKLIIVDSLPFYATLFNPDATVDAVKPMAAAMKQQMQAIPADQYAAMQPMIAAQMVKDPAGQKLVAASSASSDRAVVLEAMIEDLETDVRPQLASIKVPVLVMYEHDTTLQQPNADTYEKTMKSAYGAMPNFTLLKFDGSRHFIMYDRPEAFDAAVEGFLK